MRRGLAGLLMITVLALFASAPAMADGPSFFGLLRARDLTPFGYLRLDMKPGYIGSLEPGRWAVDSEIAYQNTWATSPEVERYLNQLPGRRTLGPDEVQAIRDLPGENYLVDLELTQYDVTLNYQISSAWSAYTILSAASIGGGKLDGTIEGFHDLIDAPRFGRRAAARNDVNLIFDLKSSQFTQLEARGYSGMLDPVFGARYAFASETGRWKGSVESAVKVPLASRHDNLSTGRTDVGVQASAQRYWHKQALYVSASAVYYAGTDQFVPEPAQIIPTIVVGYERRVTQHTNLILQTYLSRSVYKQEQTTLNELRGTKYQISGGFHHRRGPHLFSFAITENIQNINNTPDVGVQLGYSLNPGWD